MLLAPLVVAGLRGVTRAPAGEWGSPPRRASRRDVMRDVRAVRQAR
jgi:hypothetical protein